MRHLLIFAALCAALIAAGCGSTSPPRVAHPAATTCIHKTPAQAGECVGQHFGIKPGATAPTSTARAQCVDISVWQGVPNLSAVKCVIIQTNDGNTRNGLFYQQVAAAQRAHIPWGVYTFLEAFSGEAQANVALSMSDGRGRTLGVWADAEQNGVYAQACGYVNRAARSAHIYGVYSSPGLWPGYRCAGYIWPAEWGGGGAYPLPGYPASAVKLRQNCGTCRLPGFGGEVDRDEDLGLLALAKPPAPPKPKPRPSRAALLHTRALLRADLTRHRCRVAPYHGRGRYHAICAHWLAYGQTVNRQLKGAR